MDFYQLLLLASDEVKGTFNVSAYIGIHVGFDQMDEFIQFVKKSVSVSKFNYVKAKSYEWFGIFGGVKEKPYLYGSPISEYDDALMWFKAVKENDTWNFVKIL